AWWTPARGAQITWPWRKCAAISATWSITGRANADLRHGDTVRRVRGEQLRVVPATGLQHSVPRLVVPAPPLPVAQGWPRAHPTRPAFPQFQKPVRFAPRRAGGPGCQERGVTGDQVHLFAA